MHGETVKKWGGNILSDMNGKSGRTLEIQSLRFYTAFTYNYLFHLLFKPVLEVKRVVLFDRTYCIER
jgi:hypothetical protein